jgi:pilus assembly protein Flp/PilA
MKPRTRWKAFRPRSLAAFAADERGATAIEYGLIASCIVIVIIAALTGYGDQMKAQWTWVSETVVAAMTH